jgi:hypothetical protein
VAITINVNGESISYPQTGDTNWSDEATDFAVQTASAFGKLGLDIGTSVDIPQTLDVTGATTLDSTLTVAGTTTLNGTANLNGNTNLGNAITDTVAVTAILNVDSGVLYVDPATNKVGINDTTPSEALDVTGNALISGTLGVTGNSTFTGDVITSIVKASGSGGLTIDSNGGTDVALFGAGGGAGTTLYGGLNGTTGNFTDTTDATTSSDGALKTAGGVGIAKKLFVGTGILTGDGSASSPSISPISDPNSGIYSIGADKIGFSANGARVGEFGSGYGGFVGNVIQLISTTKKDIQTITTTSWGTAITGLSVTITPKYSNSLIYLFSQITCGVNSNVAVYFRLYRDSTLILVGDAAGSRDQVSYAQYPAAYTANNITSSGVNGIDSPATTSPITYSIQCRSSAGSAFINRMDTDSNTSIYARAISTITAMEVQQ